MRDTELKDVRDADALTAIEAGKWARECETYDEREAELRHDLEKAAAAAARSAVEDLKQENMMLNETIDRHGRTLDDGGGRERRGGPGRESQSRREATMSRSLGVEMERMMGDQWEEEDREDAAKTETVIAVEEAKRRRGGEGDPDDHHAEGGLVNFFFFLFEANVC
jgi:hypothetical protein